MNQLHIIGRFTTDPVISVVPGETDSRTVVNFTMAVPGRKKDDPADFFRCTAWGAAAELIGKYCHKGEKLAVTGPITFYSYTNKDGAQIYTHSVTVEHFDFMSRAAESTQPSQPATPNRRRR